jgi:hypothetical protein
LTIYQANIEKRLPWAASTSGYYYWTNVYYCNTTSGSVLADFLATVITRDRQWTLDIVEAGSWKLVNYDTGVLIDSHHTYTPRTIPHLPGDPISLTNTMYVAGLCADDSRWYKRYRLPLRAEDMDAAGNLSTTALAAFTGLAEGLITIPSLCNYRGVAVTQSRLSPRVHMWQYRDGTKRRSRSVLFP